MPIHDWSCVDPGIFHDFHQAWTIEIRNALNAGGLPPGFFAMAEQILGDPIPDDVTLQRRPKPLEPPRAGGTVAVADAPPKARFVTSAEFDRYAGKANRIVIKHRLGQVVAVLEIVSPGNKSSTHALRSFVRKTEELLWQGVQREGSRGLEKHLPEIVPFDRKTDDRKMGDADAATPVPLRRDNQ